MGIYCTSISGEPCRTIDRSAVSWLAVRCCSIDSHTRKLTKGPGLMLLMWNLHLESVVSLSVFLGVRGCATLRTWPWTTAPVSWPRRPGHASSASDVWRNLALRNYWGPIESILSGCITTWYGNCSAKNPENIQWVIKTTQHIFGTELPTMEETDSIRCCQKAQNILRDSTHPCHGLFTPLPLASGSPASEPEHPRSIRPRNRHQLPAVQDNITWFYGIYCICAIYCVCMPDMG